MAGPGHGEPPPGTVPARARGEPGSGRCRRSPDRPAGGSLTNPADAACLDAPLSVGHPAGPRLPPPPHDRPRRHQYRPELLPERAVNTKALASPSKGADSDRESPARGNPLREETRKRET